MTFENILNQKQVFEITIIFKLYISQVLGIYIHKMTDEKTFGYKKNILKWFKIAP